MKYSSEFKVGIFAIVAAIFVAWFIVRTDDRPDTAEAYKLFIDVPSAQGIVITTQVYIAGVPVGSVRHVDLAGTNAARLELEMSGEVQLSKDSKGMLVSDGVLGDKKVVVVPGTAPEFLQDGDVLTYQPPKLDMDALAAKAESIADDVKDIINSLKTMLQDEATKGSIDTTVRNLESLSEQMKQLTLANKEEVNEIARNLKEVSSALNKLVTESGTSVEEQMAIIAEATVKLDKSLGDINEITEDLKNGEGTIGALLTDDGPVQQLEDTLLMVNSTVDEVNGVVRSFSSLKTQIYYDGQYMMGVDGDMANPWAGGSRNALGIRLMPREDYWYVIEVVSHPVGKISFEHVAAPDLGAVYDKYTVTYDPRISFQFARRYGHVVLRGGLKDGSGGVGADGYFFQDRLRLNADLYDFTFGSWPALDGTPNLHVGLAVEPYPHVLLQAGSYNTLMGARHGVWTGYVGAGIYFDDDDFRWILATLPSL